MRAPCGLAALLLRSLRLVSGHRGLRAPGLSLAIAAGWFLLATSAGAQQGCAGDLSPLCPNYAPAITIEVSAAETAQATITLTVYASDAEGLALGTLQLLNGTTNMSSWFGQAVSSNPGAQSTSVSWTGSFTLVSGQNALSVSVCDVVQPALCGSASKLVTYTPPPTPVLPFQATPELTLAQRGDARDLNAGGATYDYATPAYQSVNRSRAVALHYASQTANPNALVQVDATIRSVEIPSRVSIQVTRAADGSIVFPEAFFAGDTGVLRLAAQFTETCALACAPLYTVRVRAYYGSDSWYFTQNLSVRLLQQNASTSPYGAGWTMAGIERVHVQSDGVVIANGAGALQFFAKTSCTGSGATEACTYQSPIGDATTLRRAPAHPIYGTRYVRGSRSGDSTYYDDSGLMRYARERFVKNETQVTWSSGVLGSRVATIVDPMLKVTTLTYEPDAGGSGFRPGALRYIDLPDGRRVTAQVANSSLDLVRLDGPDGVADLQATYETATHRLLTHTERVGGGGFTYDATGFVVKVVGPDVLLESGGMGHDSVLVSPVASKALVNSASTYASVPMQKGLRADSAFVRSIASNGVTITAWLHLSGGATRMVTQAANGDTTVMATDFGSAYQPASVRTTGQAAAAFSYDSSGVLLLSATQGASGETTTYSYDSFDQVKTVHVNGTKMMEAFFSGSRLAPDSVKSDSANSQRYKVDAYGRVRSVRNARQELDSVSVEPTHGNTASSIRSAPGVATRLVTFSYDASGRRTQVTDHLGRIYVTAFNVLNRVTQQTALGADVSSYAYNDAVRTYTFTDPMGNAYTTVTNAAGWTVSTTDPRNQVATFGYDRRGNLLRATDRRGQVVTWTKDALDRDLTRTAGGDVTTYAYDPKQRWVAVQNAESTDTLFVDAAGRPTAAITTRGGTRYVLNQGFIGTMPDGLTIKSYDAPNGGALWTRTMGSGYDPMRRTAFLQDFGGAGTQTSYDRAQAEKTITLPTAAAVRTNTFSAYGELTQMTFTGASAAFSRSYARDYSSRIGEITFGWDSRVHNYDARDRLMDYRDTQTWTETVWEPWDPYGDCPGCMIQTEVTHVDTLRAGAYVYDKIANQTGAGIAYQSGGGSRLVQFSGETFTYDAEGNLTQRTGPADTTSYTWNALGQLSTVSSPQGTTTYGYDGWGQRVRKSVNGATTRYLLHNANVMLELDAYNGILAEYTYYPGADRPHGMRRGGVQYYYAQDGEGNVRGVINTAGAVVASYDYSPQGELVGSTGSVTNPYRYKGREWDAEAGLYFMRARYYDPKVARFVSEDPIGVAGGMSLYAFGGGDPVNYSDPSGLAPCSEATISAGGWHSVELEPGDWWCLPVYTLQESRINGFGGRATSAFGFGRGVGAGIPYIPGSGGSNHPSPNPTQSRINRECLTALADFGLTAGADFLFFSGVTTGIRGVQTARSLALIGANKMKKGIGYFEKADNLRQAALPAVRNGFFDYYLGGVITDVPEINSIWDMADLIPGLASFKSAVDLGLACSGRSN